jgi:hypothetical protein
MKPNPTPILQPVDRVPFHFSAEALRIHPFVAKYGPITKLTKNGETKHWIILSTQQELVIPMMGFFGSPVDYFARELNRCFGIGNTKCDSLEYYRLDVTRYVAKSIFYHPSQHKPQNLEDRLKFYEYTKA